jgi:prophage regulatory protein
MHERLLKVSEVQARLGVSRAAVYKWIGEGRFPAPLKLGPKAARWPESVVNRWIDDVVARSAEGAAQ